jgi:4-amino-4-deoxy-L-arabinose transferase-like glycosyltransferase
MSERPRHLGLELALVVLVSAVVLVPGISKYSLVDPWETHYGEVARNMLKDNDLVHMQWPGANPDGSLNEGFKSKPVLTFWLEAAGLAMVGVARHGGYSGEMVESARTMVGIRLPIVACAIFGLTLVWYMLAKLVNRRLAWLALLVVGSCPMFCMIARQGIPDMPLCATTMGAIALFFLAIEDGDRPVEEHRWWRLRFDSRHVALGLAGGFVVLQAIYYAVYFISSPQLAVVGQLPHPALWLPLMMLFLLGALQRDFFLIFRLPFLLIGGIVAAIVNEPMPRKRPEQSWWRALVDNILEPWDRHAADRYIVRGLVFPVVWAAGGDWALTNDVASHVLGMKPITSMRQIYLIGCYSLLGVSVLAKGPPGLAVCGFVGVFYIVLMWRWRALYEGAFELKRGLLLMVGTFLPWHIAMFLKDGVSFVNEYLFTHLLNRATDGSVDKSYGTFSYYTLEIGNGMWLWAALLPAAITSLLLHARSDNREGRVRFLVGMWAIASVGFFSLVQTKFHHYILPAVPPLAIAVAFFLDDLATKRARLHYLFAAIAVGIVLLVCRDLVHDPKRWIEMFVFRYDRPWPTGDPWFVDPSDGFLALGGIACAAIVLAITPWTRLAVGALCAAGLAICVWSLQAYMPVAGTHWGMREAARTYYEQRQIYGERIIYSGTAQLANDWRDVTDHWSFDTFIPDTLQLGQPMTIQLDVVKPDDDKVRQHDLQLVGTVSEIGDHTVTVLFDRHERAKLDAVIADGTTKPVSPRLPVYLVDADKLVVWQLYWRGEQFWSGGEINGPTPDTRTTFQSSNSAEVLKYFNDRSRAPLGRRYFVISEGGRIPGIRSQLPTQRAKDSYEILDNTSNKFSIAAFFL